MSTAAKTTLAGERPEEEGELRWAVARTRRVWNWGRSELRRHAQPGVRLAGGVQADPNVWRAGVACWRRALGTRYVRGGAVCGWLSITGSLIGGGVNSERDTRTLAWRGGYGHPHPSVWQAPLRLWSRTTIRPLRRHTRLCHHLSEACLGPQPQPHRSRRTAKQIMS